MALTWGLLLLLYTVFCLYLYIFFPISSIGCFDNIFHLVAILRIQLLAVCRCHCYDSIPLAEIHERDTLRCTSCNSNGTHISANDYTACGDEHEVVITLTDDTGGCNAAGLLRHFQGDHATTTTALSGILF